MISLTITYLKKRVTIQVDEKLRLREFKERLALEFDVPIDSIRLLYSGFQMKDEKCTLESFGVDDGSKIMMLSTKQIHNNNNNNNNTFTSTTSTTTTTNNNNNVVELNNIQKMERKLDINLPSIIHVYYNVYLSLLSRVSQIDDMLYLTEKYQLPKKTIEKYHTEKIPGDLPQVFDTPEGVERLHRYLSEKLLRIILEYDCFQVSNEQERMVRKACIQTVQQILTAMDRIKAEFKQMFRQ